MDLFTAPDAWNGGFFELCMQFEQLNRNQVKQILERIWTHPAMRGVYLDAFQEPDQQTSYSVSQTFDMEKNEWETLKGTAHLPEGQVACSTVVVTLTGLPEGTTEQDVWVDFFFPLGSLGKIHPVEAYPFDCDEVDHEAWVISVEQWLTELGQHVFEIHPFQMALIGFETSGMADANDLKDSGPPARRSRVYLWPEQERLQVYPRTEQA